MRELSENNQYWLSKHRTLELKHFCLQYGEWKKHLRFYQSFTTNTNPIPGYDIKDDRTAIIATKLAYYGQKIELVERIARETDFDMSNYILQYATKGVPYTYFVTHENIPCGRDAFYDRVRKFFWLLDKER